MVVGHRILFWVVCVETCVSGLNVQILGVIMIIYNKIESA